MLGLNDVECREREDGTGYYHTTTRTDALDDDILAKCALALGGTRQSDSDDGNRYGSLKDLSDLESKIGSSGTEQYCHEQAPNHRPNGHFSRITLSRHDRLVGFAFTQFAHCIFRQTSLILVFFHD